MVFNIAIKAGYWADAVLMLAALNAMSVKILQGDMCFMALVYANAGSWKFWRHGKKRRMVPSDGFVLVERARIV